MWNANFENTAYIRGLRSERLIRRGHLLPTQLIHRRRVWALGQYRKEVRKERYKTTSQGLRFGGLRA